MKEIGFITSGTFGPSVNALLPWVILNLNFQRLVTKINLEVRGKKHEA